MFQAYVKWAHRTAHSSHSRVQTVVPQTQCWENSDWKRIKSNSQIMQTKWV